MSTTTVNRTLETLLHAEARPCISVFVGPAGPAKAEQRRLRFRALCGQVEKALEEAAVDPRLRRKLLDPLQEAALDVPAETLARGEALYRNPGIFRRLKLSAPVDDFCFVGDEFY